MLKRFIAALMLLTLAAQPSLAATRIIEYGGVSTMSRAYPVIPAEMYVTSQTAITASGTSAQSAAFNAATSFVCVQSDEAVYLLFGTSPTATTNDYRLQAGAEQCFSIRFGSSWKVAVRT